MRHSGDLAELDLDELHLRERGAKTSTGLLLCKVDSLILYFVLAFSCALHGIN